MPKAKSGRAKRKARAAALARRGKLQTSAIAAAKASSSVERPSDSIISLRDAFGVSQVGLARDLEDVDLGILDEFDVSELPKREKRKVKSQAFRKRLELEAALREEAEARPLSMGTLSLELNALLGEMEEDEKEERKAQQSGMGGNGGMGGGDGSNGNAHGNAVFISRARKNGAITSGARAVSKAHAVSQFSRVATHQAFQNDPLGSIESHVLASVSAIQSMKGGKKRGKKGKGGGKKGAKATGKGPGRRKKFGKSQRR